jgi:hypothetical protein
MKPNTHSRPGAPSRLARAARLRLPCCAKPKNALICAGLVVLVQPAKAAVTEAWVQRYSGLGIGNSWGIPGASAVAVDPSGNVVVTGGAYSGNKMDYYTAKYAAADGVLLWEQRYHGPNSNWDDSAHALALDADGNVVVTGGSAADGLENGTYDMYTAKYAAADGTLLWENRYHGPAKLNDIGWAVAVDRNGNVVVAGLSEYFVTNNNLNHYIAKYAAADGALLWEHRHANSGAIGGLALDDSGNVVVTGVAYDGVTNRVYTAKYAAPDGALLWEKQLAGLAGGDGPSAIVDNRGNVAMTVSIDTGSGADLYTAKYAAADGALIWEKRYNGPANLNDLTYAIAVDSSGNVIVTGTTDEDFVYTGATFYTAKYAAVDGAVIWEKRYNGPAKGDDAGYAVAMDNSGNAVVTGVSFNVSNSDFYTAKYAAADGALLWEKRYNGPANGTEYPAMRRGLALGQNGMVAIAGSSMGTSGTNEFTTIVYRENLPPPSLSSSFSGSALSLSWPTNATGFVLQSATTLANGGDWQDSSLTPAIVGNQTIVTVDATNTAGFFRLRGQ